MAWELEQNPITNQPEYVWSGMENGIGDSPYTGISFMSGFNIKSYPKCAYSNLARTDATMPSGAPSEETNYELQDPANFNCVYSVSIAGVVRQSIDSGATWTVVTAISYDDSYGKGQGLFIWGKFLHVVSKVNIYTIQITATGTTGGWTRLSDNAGVFPIMLLAQNAPITHYSFYCTFDKRVYICNGNYISTFIPGISPVTGAFVTYDPADDTTYTWNEQALKLAGTSDLSTYYTATPAVYLEQLQDKLLIAQGNVIIPWDRNSTQYDTPFPFSENIGKMININNTIYVFGGIPTYTGSSVYRTVIQGRGNIFYYNGFAGGFFKKLPDSINTNFINDPTWLIGGLMSFQNKIYFGAIPNNGSPNFTGGVYSLDISAENQALQYQIAVAPLNIETSSSATYLYTTLCYTGNLPGLASILDYSGGYINTFDSSYGYNYTNSNNREQGDLTTDILQVGTNLNPATFNQIEVRFRNPLAVGETVLVQARNYFNGSISINGSFTYTAPAASTDISFTCPVIVQSNEELAIRVVTTPISGGSNSGIPIKQIRLISNMK